jgi:hypothetical protein
MTGETVGAAPTFDGAVTTFGKGAIGATDAGIVIIMPITMMMKMIASVIPSMIYN